MENKKNPVWEHTIDIVCKYYHVSKDKVFTKSKKKEIVLARRVIYKILSETVASSFKQEYISEQLGGFNRSLLSYYKRIHNNSMETDKMYAEQYNEIMEMVKK